MQAREGPAGEGPAGERPAGEGPGRLPCATTRAVASGLPQACVLCARCSPALGAWGPRRPVRSIFPQERSSSGQRGKCQLLSGAFCGLGCPRFPQWALGLQLLKARG